MGQDARCLAAEQRAFEPAPPVGCQDDQIASSRLGGLQDAFGSIVLDVHCRALDVHVLCDPINGAQDFAAVSPAALSKASKGKTTVPWQVRAAAQGSDPVTAVAFAWKPLASSNPALTAFSDSFEPSVAIKMCRYMEHAHYVPSCSIRCCGSRLYAAVRDENSLVHPTNQYRATHHIGTNPETCAGVTAAAGCVPQHRSDDVGQTRESAPAHGMSAATRPVSRRRPAL